MNRLGYWRTGICVLLLASSAQAQMRERVLAVTDDQTVLLTSGKARFAQIVFPDAALAQRWLAAHVLQQDIEFTVVGTDRYGRMQVDSPLEEALLREGVAVLFPQGPVPPSWQAAEAMARQGKRGVWARPDFILTPDTAATHIHAFGIVEGVVTHLYRAKTATYLNFGANWHTDFSVTISGRARRSIEAKLATVKEGTRVRVRGGIYEENGPMIHLTSAEQIEILPTP